MLTYGYTYGGPGFGPGATRTKPYPTANGISYANATYVNPTSTAPSTTAPYYNTTAAAAQNANSNVNAVTAPTVTKMPVPAPLRTFRTMLLTTRPCERRLELDVREGVNNQRRSRRDRSTQPFDLLCTLPYLPTPYLPVISCNVSKNSRFD